MAENLQENDDEELIPVEEDPNAKQPEAEEPEADDSDDDDDGDDERLAESEDDSEEDIVNNKNRERRHKRREIRKRAKENAERELRMLREQNEMLMRRVSAVEGHAVSQSVAQIDQKLAEAVREAKQAEMIIAKAVEAGNGEDVAAAMRIRDEATARANQIYHAKQQWEQSRQQQAAPGPDPRVANLAQQWMQANPWYDPQGRDEDSAITNAIDKTLVNEGYDPKSIDYWEELTARVAARISDDDGGAQRKASVAKKKAPPMGSGREHVPASTKKEVYVTPERKQAMIDAGIWDDPVRRNQMLKAYRDYDQSSAR